MTKPVSIDVRLNCVNATLRTILSSLTASDANGQDHDVSNAVVAMRPVLDELQDIHERLDAISTACGGLLWDTETPTTPTKPEAPSNPLEDEDSPAYQVRAFLRSVKTLDGNNTSAEEQLGRDLINDYVLSLAVQSEPATLTIPEVALVLRYLSSIQPRPGFEDYAAGGASNCGHLHIMTWLSRQLQAVQS